MALSVLKVRTSPPGPEPAMRVCAGKGVSVRETIGTQKKNRNGLREELDEVIVDRQCTQRSIRKNMATVHPNHSAFPLILTNIMAEICKTARLRKKIVAKSSRPKWLIGG